MATLANSRWILRTTMHTYVQVLRGSSGVVDRGDRMIYVVTAVKAKDPFPSLGVGSCGVARS